MNIAVLAGTLSSDPAIRTLPSGDELCLLQLTITAPDGGRARSVPVRVTGTAAPWKAGDQLLVIGRVSRRFFRAAGRTASATEVEAARVIPLRNRRTVSHALDAVGAQLVSP